MDSSFIFSFDNPRPALRRKYRFSLSFKDTKHYEDCLDWLESGTDVAKLIVDLEQYGYHDVVFNPRREFYGFESGNINFKSYITVVEAWRDFFLDHGIDTGDIFEETNVIE